MIRLRSLLQIQSPLRLTVVIRGVGNSHQELSPHLHHEGRSSLLHGHSSSDGVISKAASKTRLYHTSMVMSGSSNNCSNGSTIYNKENSTNNEDLNNIGNDRIQGNISCPVRRGKNKRRRNNNNAAAINTSKIPNHYYEIFASTVPGLEKILSDELETKIQISKKSNQRIREGGILFTITSIEELYKCHLHLGTASHLFLRASLPTPDDANVDNSGNSKRQGKKSSLSTTTTFRATRMRQLVQKVSQMRIWKDIISVGYSGSSNATSGSIPKFDIRVSASKSKLYHTKGIAERVEMGIYKALGIAKNSEVKNESIRIRENIENEIDELFGNNNNRKKHKSTGNNITKSSAYQNNDDDEPRIRVLVRIHRDEVEISLDTSLTPLHRRGYKLDVCKAPLREDIAFGFLHSLGWPLSIDSSPRSSSHVPFQKCLVDPFCGSGTILIEGANMAMGFPPGRLRPPPCEYTSLYNEKLWNEMIQSAMDDARGIANRTLMEQKEQQQEMPLILGSDRDAGAIRATVANAKRAGVDKFIEVGNYPLRSSPWLDQANPQNNQQTSITGGIPKELLIATNPPFGLRISSSKKKNKSGDSQVGRDEPKLLRLYQTFGMIVQRLRGSNGSLSVQNNGFHGDVNVGLVAHDISIARRTGIALKSMFTTHLGGATISALQSVNEK